MLLVCNIYVCEEHKSSPVNWPTRLHYMRWHMPRVATYCLGKRRNLLLKKEEEHKHTPSHHQRTATRTLRKGDCTHASSLRRNQQSQQPAQQQPRVAGTGQTEKRPSATSIPLRRHSLSEKQGISSSSSSSSSSPPSRPVRCMAQYQQICGASRKREALQALQEESLAKRNRYCARRRVSFCRTAKRHDGCECGTVTY